MSDLRSKGDIALYIEEIAAERDNDQGRLFAVRKELSERGVTDRIKQAVLADIDAHPDDYPEFHDALIEARYRRVVHKEYCADPSFSEATIWGSLEEAQEIEDGVPLWEREHFYGPARRVRVQPGE